MNQAGSLALVAALWIATFTLAAHRVPRQRPDDATPTPQTPEYALAGKRDG